MKDTQNQKIIKYLKQHTWITPIEALSMFGCMRLASRVNELRAMGYNIISEPATGKNMDGETVHFAKYKLADGGEKRQ